MREEAIWGSGSKGLGTERKSNRIKILRVKAAHAGITLLAGLAIIGVAGRAESPEGKWIPLDNAASIQGPVTSADFQVLKGSYLPNLLLRTEVSWSQLLPDDARPRHNKRGRVAKGTVTVQFVIHTDGTVTNIEPIQRSGDAAMDFAAWAAVRNAAPYPKLPAGYSQNKLTLRFMFLYNEKLSGDAPAKDK